MINFIIATGIIFTLLAGWVFMQHAARTFAAKHPELGAAKQEGEGCAKACGCRPGRCERDD